MNTNTLVRSYRHSTYLNFTIPQACPECQGRLEVKDHRAPWFSPPYTASKEWRYEVVCKDCRWCDCNGYASQRTVLEAYPAPPIEEQIKTLRAMIAKKGLPINLNL